MRRRIEEHAERQRARIMEAAAEAFAEHGFHAASMATIAKKAGVSQGLAYCYFQNKHAIFESLLNEKMERFWESFRDTHTKEEFLEHNLSCLTNLFPPEGPRLDAALYIEMRAEATRNPEVAACMLRVDKMGEQVYKKIIGNIFRESGHPLDEETLNEKVFLLDMLTDGFVSLLLRNPGENTPHRFETLKRCMREILESNHFRA